MVAEFTFFVGKKCTEWWRFCEFNCEFEQEEEECSSEESDDEEPAPRRRGKKGGKGAAQDAPAECKQQ